MSQPPERTNVLFICTMNQWRSPTGERLWRRSQRIATRSAGTSPNAKRTVNAKDVAWADVILVMEHKHKDRLRAKLPGPTRYADIRILDVPDEFPFMHPELVAQLEVAVPRALGFDP